MAHGSPEKWVVQLALVLPGISATIKSDLGCSCIELILLQFATRSESFLRISAAHLSYTRFRAQLYYAEAFAATLLRAISSYGARPSTFIVNINAQPYAIVLERLKPSYFEATLPSVAPS
ncbi:hypothetical protein MRX96_002968 [Rhipicephalus microplus]